MHRSKQKPFSDAGSDLEGQGDGEMATEKSVVLVFRNLSGLYADVRRIRSPKEGRHEDNELAIVSPLRGSCVQHSRKELGVNNPLRRLVLSCCRGMIW
jgi:hypothetical protein